jgi:hypothetical protein
MKIAVVLAIVAAGLAACTTPSYTRKTAGVIGNEVSVTISNVWGMKQALPLADEHCHKYGKAARLSVRGEYSFTFDCVTP